MLKELAVRNPSQPRSDAEWSTEELGRLNRTALGLVSGFFDVERILSVNELQTDQRVALVCPLAQCCHHLFEVFPLLDVDVSVYPASEKLNRGMVSRPMLMFQLRKDIATYAAYVAYVSYGDALEKVTLLRKQPTLRLDLAYTALGIWGQFRSLAVRYRVDMDDILHRIKGEQGASTETA